MVNFKENYHFSRFQRGSNIFKGGLTFSMGGSNCLFPIETHITCDYPGGPDPQSPPPSGSALEPSELCQSPKPSLMVIEQIIEPVHEIYNNVLCATSKGSDQPSHTRSLIRVFASRLNIL